MPSAVRADHTTGQGGGWSTLVKDALPCLLMLSSEHRLDYTALTKRLMPICRWESRRSSQLTSYRKLAIATTAHQLGCPADADTPGLLLRIAGVHQLHPHTADVGPEAPDPS